MQVLDYNCDGGCIVLGNSSFRAKLPNGEGDGTYNIYICHNQMDLEAALYDLHVHKFELDFVSVVSGNINVYRYDCYHSNEEFEKNILVNLNGVYRVYSYMGNIVLFENE